MISDELRRRLESLNRAPLPGDSHTGDSLSAVRGTPAKGAPRRIEELFAGREVRYQGTSCYRIERRLSEWWPARAPLAQRYLGLAEARASKTTPARTSPSLAQLIRALPESLVYLDIETCGFAGMPVFLVGLLRCRGHDFVFEQFFARDYSEEPAVLAQFGRSIGGHELLVTFNGKSFDWPCLCDRAAVHRIVLRRDRPHCDLLHEARRAWSGSLPDCRLQTLEAHKCGRRRVADIPGSAIPDAYHRFVQTGNARPMEDVITHNALDLLTLAELTVHLVS